MRFRVLIQQETARWWETWNQETDDPDTLARARVARYNDQRGPMDPERRVLKVRVPRNRHPRQTSFKLCA